MITRKAFIQQLETMGASDVLVRYGDYRNTHPLAATPLQKRLSELVGVATVEAKRYITRRGITHQSPDWLVAAYRELATLIYAGNDINVRTFLTILSR